MEYQTYYDLARKGAAFDEAGDQHAAIEVFIGLVNSDISDLDKANMCYNVAHCCDKLGQTEQALAWYAEGAAYEKPYCRIQLHEWQASYLAKLGRDAEALAIYESLYEQPYLLEIEKERIWGNIAILRNPRKT
ncbi:MAG: hypothetical protein GC168_06300 [Candidatus Hydrogenedens sp.]|nr:hypothetical protein [Candidatus Hydrogenedens sp.]